MDIPVTLNLLEDKHTSNFEQLASMSLIHQEDNCSLIILSFAENTPANLIDQLREGCKESLTYHIIRTDKLDPPPTTNQPYRWLKDECICSRDEYLLLEINDATCTLKLKLKGGH